MNRYPPYCLLKRGNWAISDIQPRRMALYRGTESVEGEGGGVDECPEMQERILRPLPEH